MPGHSIPGTPVRTDPQEIGRTVSVLFRPGDVVEVRIPKTEGQGTISGYFSDPELLTKALTVPNGRVLTVYVTLNPVTPSLLARAANRVKTHAKTTTSDKDIACRRWLLIDCDAVRPAEISSTDAEHEAALERARQIRFTLTEEGWPAPILADSGNGAHLLYRIDLPNDEASASLIAAVLKALASKFDDAAVKIDQTVFNASRITKAYGTAVRKGDNIAERPHRLSRMLDIPQSSESVSRELLAQIAQALSSSPPSSQPFARLTDFDVTNWLKKHGIEAGPPAPYIVGLRWVFPCPFNREHKDAAAFQSPTGRLGFHCPHNSCSDKNWAALQRLLGGESARADSWPEALPIGSELPSVAAFDPMLLPEGLRAFVEDVAERMQVPLDYPAACLMVAMAGAINRRARIQPKAGDSSWRVIPNLWGGIIAPPGFLKSPVLQAIAAPLYAQEARWREQHETDIEEFVTQKEELDLRIAAWKEQTKANFKKGPQLVKPGSQPPRPDTSIRPPTLKRIITCDSTFEKLHELMQENPAGLLVIRDELTGWWSELDREGRQGERGFFLSAWNGDTPFTIDRIGRGSVHVPACCVSMMGGITPGRLRSYLIDALQDGPSNDGLIQRFQVLVWPDPPRAWRYVDRQPAKIEIITQMFERIFRWDSDLPAEFRFNSEAQEFFRAWLSDLELKIRSDELHPALISHLAKYRKLMPALSLLLETADQLLTMGALHDPPVVCVEHAEKAARCCTYLESHAQRIYSAVVTPTMQAAADLAAKLKAKAVGADGVFAVRDVYRHCWSRLDTPERVMAALDVLADAGWVRAIKNDSGPGRPSNQYSVNPRLHQDGPK